MKPYNRESSPGAGIRAGSAEPCSAGGRSARRTEGRPQQRARTERARGKNEFLRRHPPGPALPASFPGRPGSEKRGPQQPAAAASSRGPRRPPGAVPARSHPHASPPARPPAPLDPAQTAHGTAPPLGKLQAAPRAQQPPPPSRGSRFRGGAAAGNGARGAASVTVTFAKEAMKRSPPRTGTGAQQPPAISSPLTRDRDWDRGLRSRLAGSAGYRTKNSTGSNKVLELPHCLKHSEIPEP
ncbi:proline-rich proteoglycan 2-like [Gallus gallus]|uniref:proline-rich proteoglycan 2-like n=1 Tax=Gallus gallus TaxID=9031 RepID=UPI001F0296E8|nr:proline-rich proteoglycan 2-like [Gallus gallus]